MIVLISLFYAIAAVYLLAFVNRFVSFSREKLLEMAIDREAEIFLECSQEQLQRAASQMGIDETIQGKESLARAIAKKLSKRGCTFSQCDAIIKRNKQKETRP